VAEVGDAWGPEAVMVMVAPGMTAPVGSTTVPEMLAGAFCASAAADCAQAGNWAHARTRAATKTVPGTRQSRRRWRKNSMRTVHSSCVDQRLYYAEALSGNQGRKSQINRGRRGPVRQRGLEEPRWFYRRIRRKKRSGKRQGSGRSRCLGLHRRVRWSPIAGNGQVETCL